MLVMSVTLDVSKLSGWLNADACCQAVRRHTKRVRCGLGVRKARVTAAKAACREDPSRKWEQGTRRAHVKHAVHVCDAGRVETERLVERRR
eukprot:scaffold23131_cov61-Phaeocystis_antarctica.AAC.6